MFLLDTNVLSEPLKARPSPNVLLWLDRQRAHTLYLTSTSLAEVFTGIESLPDGVRKRNLAESTHRLILSLFGDRILAFDASAAFAYASLVSHARFYGRTISIADGQIAAIAQVHGFTVATRDTSPFMAAGVPIVDPWSFQSKR